MVFAMIVVSPSFVPLARNNVIGLTNLIVKNLRVDELATDGLEGHVFFFY